jgi:tetratricopeptide (TPR) repeat protein
MPESTEKPAAKPAPAAAAKKPAGTAPRKSARKPAPRKPGAKRASIWRDPIVRTLAWIAAALVVLYLITIVAALVMGVLRSTGPRTALERDEQIYEAAVQQNPSDVDAWRRYIDSLVGNGQFAAAQAAVDRALAAADETGTEAISTALARLHFATGRYQDAIDVADESRTRLETWYEVAKAQEDSPEARGNEINENYWALQLLKSEAYARLNDLPAAIEAIDVFLEARPTAADVLVRRGYLKIDAGDTAGAEADFRRALDFLPGDETALEGLKQIGVEE